jgi:hypothetical protein
MALKVRHTLSTLPSIRDFNINYIVFTGSQMPRHLISDAHEWINEIPTVPIYYLAKPQPRERAWQNQRGKKTLSQYSMGSKRLDSRFNF